MKIGVISDTHGFWDPQIPELFEGVDHILHAGDIDSAWILFQLEQIAPVTAVLGNNDCDLTLPEVARKELAGRKFWLQHIVNPRAMDDTMVRGLARHQINGVIFGHTHKFFREYIGDILFLHPGYAGRPKLGAERSLALLQVPDSPTQPFQADCIPLGG